jgi:light-regulated signal transduction histidine kinase (bacteriophytochrome)
VTLLVAEGRDITEQKQQRQRTAMMQRVMRHNMRNDLNKVRGWAQLIAEESNAEARADQLGHVERTLDEWEAMAEELKKIRQVSQSTDANQPTTEARSVITDVVSHSREAHPTLEIEAITGDVEGLRIPSVVEEAITALIRVTADRQTDEAAQVDVSLSDSTDDWIQIDIVDTGRRLTEMETEVLATGEETALIHGQGTGVWLVRTMIKEAGGDISAQRRDTEVTVSFRVPAT